MITSDTQRERTVELIEAFRKALKDNTIDAKGKRSAAIRGSYEGILRQLEDELRDYDRKCEARRSL